MSVDVLDRRLVSPGDVAGIDAEGSGDGLSVSGAGGPAAEIDCRHAIRVQPAAVAEFLEGDVLRAADAVDALAHGALAHGPDSRLRCVVG